MNQRELGALFAHGHFNPDAEAGNLSLGRRLSKTDDFTLLYSYATPVAYFNKQTNTAVFTDRNFSTATARGKGVVRHVCEDVEDCNVVVVDHDVFVENLRAMGLREQELGRC